MGNTTTSKRAKKVVEVLSDIEKWDSWIINNPARMASLLGLCSDGTAAIQELRPSLEQLKTLVRPEILHPMRTLRDQNTSNSRRAMMSDNREEAIVKGVEKLLGFLELGVKEKKKKDKLAALVKAWERCGFYKDLFIQLFLNDKINKENKKKAQAIYDDLKGLQDALKTLKKEIEHDDEKGIEEATEKAQKLADDILKGLVNM